MPVFFSGESAAAESDQDGSKRMTEAMVKACWPRLLQCLVLQGHCVPLGIYSLTPSDCLADTATAVAAEIPGGDGAEEGSALGAEDAQTEPEPKGLLVSKVMSLCAVKLWRLDLHFDE